MCHAGDDVFLGEDVDDDDGRIETTEPAITTFQSVVNWPFNDERPSGSVISSGERMTTRGHRNEFQDSMKAKTVSAAIAGLTRGMISRPQILRWPAPSIRAASSIETGMVEKYCVNKKIENALAMNGTIITS